MKKERNMSNLNKKKKKKKKTVFEKKKKKKKKNNFFKKKKKKKVSYTISVRTLDDAETGSMCATALP
jgi:hypothetical protein